MLSGRCRARKGERGARGASNEVVPQYQQEDLRRGGHGAMLVVGVARGHAQRVYRLLGEFGFASLLNKHKGERVTTVHDYCGGCHATL